MRDRLARQRMDGCLVGKKYRNGSRCNKLETLVVDSNVNLPLSIPIASIPSFLSRPLWRLRCGKYARLH